MNPPQTRRKMNCGDIPYPAEKHVGPPVSYLLPECLCSSMRSGAMPSCRSLVQNRRKNWPITTLTPVRTARSPTRITKLGNGHTETTKRPRCEKEADRDVQVEELVVGAGPNDPGGDHVLKCPGGLRFLATEGKI